VPERRRLPLFALFAANAISLSGNVVALVAIPWFVLQETGSAALTGLSGFFTFLPTVLSAFFGGVVVDRLGFRTTSVVADLASAAAVAAIPALHLTIGLELWQLFALVFLGALLDAPGATARRALLPDLVELAGMPMERATSIAQAIFQGSYLVGAPIGGVLVATIGATNTLWVDAVSFLASAALIGMLAPVAVSAAREVKTGYFADLAVGLRFIWHDRLIRAVVITVLLTNFLDAPLSPVILPVLVDEEFGSAEYLGVLLGVFGGAAVVGAAAFGAIGHRLPRRRTFVVAFFVASLPYLALATTPSLALTVVIVVVFGIAAAPLNPILATVGYERIPAEMRGRVLGALTAGAYSAIPLGILVGGLLVEAIGVGPTLLVIGVCYVAVTAYGFFNPAFREMDRVPDKPSDWTIRQARREDAEAFVRAHEAAWDAVGLAEQRLGDLVPFERRVRRFEDGLPSVGDDAQVWIAERDEQIVGLATCVREANGGELRDLYVIPEAWGSGVASALHQTAVEWLRSRHEEAILWVAEANARARRFYEREGWTEDGETRQSALGPRELRYRITF
jgi:MFS family permease/N-acetylglutamate synthase-like GNAT family acetyltransferase